MDNYDDNFFMVDERFWTALESFFKQKIPVYLKNVMSANGYGNISSLSKLRNDRFEEIEATIRSFYRLGSKGTAGTLHLYRDSPQMFKIVPGHRELILELSSQLKSQLNEFNQFRLSESSSMASSSSPSISGSCSSVQYNNSHIRIINQLINLYIKVPADISLDIRIVNSDTATVSCFLCNQDVVIKTRILSTTNRQWMIGQYIDHIKLHGPSEDDNSTHEEGDDPSDSKDDIELSDELDRRVLELSRIPKAHQIPLKPQISRSLKRNIKMTTETAHDTKQRRITQLFGSSSAEKQHVFVEPPPKKPEPNDHQLLLALIDKLPLTFMVKTIVRETVQNNYKNILTKTTKAKGARYSVECKNIGAYLYLMGGRKDYEELVVNLGLPSLSTILRHIHKSCDKIIEGKLRIEQLSQFLEARHLPKAVFISEDGTKVTTRVRYDIERDQISGLCPKLTENGIPEVESFPAKTPELIKLYMDTNAKSSIVYVILATSMAAKTLSFNLLSFGTDNKFTIDEVLLRWAVMEKEMVRYGITIVGYGADGDSRLIGSMKVRMGLPRAISISPTDIPVEWKNWYAAKGRTRAVYVQDTTHIINKLKNSLLSYTRSLQIGKFPASRGHLEIVAKDGKENTGLLESDLEQLDKMSVKTFHKLIDPRVALWLKKNPGTNGTVAYISLMNAVYDSYENASLSPLKRIEDIWFATFFIRVWHHWIKGHKQLKLDDNFITDNAELGIELNAHSLVNFLLFCRDLNAPDIFLPTLLNSQHNERSFANARSMTGVQNTVINFDILDYLNKATRFEYLDELRVVPKDKFSFARGNYKHVNFENFTFPSNKDIELAVMKGKQRAQKLLNYTGLEWDEEDFTCAISVSNRTEIYPINEVNIPNEAFDAYDHADQVYFEDEPEDLIFEADTLFNQIGSDFNKVCKYTPGEQKTPHGFFKIMTSTGEVMLARKGTVVWLLSTDHTKISNDRLLRFRAQSSKEADLLNSNENRVMPYVTVGDWFVYTQTRKCIAAQVLGFVYLKGRLKRERECSLKSVPIEVPDHIRNPKGIGIICNKFSILSNNTLSIVSDTSKINIEKYASHIKKPHLQDTFKITEETRSYLDTLIDKLVKV